MAHLATIAPRRVVETEEHPHKLSFHPAYDPKGSYRRQIREPVPEAPYTAVFVDDGLGGHWARYVDPTLGPDHSQPANSVASPKSDSSGVWWSVPGFWRFQAWSLEAAEEEVRRLCAVAGYRAEDGLSRLRCERS